MKLKPQYDNKGVLQNISLFENIYTGIFELHNPDDPYTEKEFEELLLNMAKRRAYLTEKSEKLFKKRKRLEYEISQIDILKQEINQLTGWYKDEDRTTTE